MALVINLVTVDPVTDLVATPTLGGSLVNGTTYYYRLISCYKYMDGAVSVVPILSLPSDEVSFTADATNNTCTLTWTEAANATGYIIQRTTTSGSYPPCQANSFYLYGSPGGGVCFWPGDTFLDIGSTTGTGNRTLTGYNLDHSVAYPCIDASVTADETLTLELIYQADLTAGWGIIDKLCTTGLKTFTSGRFIDQVPFVITGSLYLHDCNYRQRGMLISLGGVISADFYQTVKLDLGDTLSRYAPYMFWMSPYTGNQISADHTTFTGYVPWAQRLHGTTTSTIYGLIRRSLLFYNDNISPYNAGPWDDGVKISDAPLSNSIIGYNSGNGMPIFSVGNTTGTIFEGARPSNYYTGEISDVSFRFSSGYPHLWGWVDHSILRRVKFLSGLTVDAHVGGSEYQGAFIDCEYHSKGQTNQIPYFYVRATADNMIGHGWDHQFTLSLKVQDTSGNPISGATVTIKDVNGYDDIWESTGVRITANATNTWNNTDSTSNLKIVTTGFSVDEYIRFSHGSEILKITEITSGTQLKVDRGQCSSTKEFLNYLSTAYVYKRLDSGTTDASGNFTTEQGCIGRSCYVAVNNGNHNNTGYETALVTSGVITQNTRTPHTVTISKSGYVTKTIKYTMDRKREEIEVLEAVVPWIAPQGASLYWNTDKTNSQNKFGYAPL